MAAKQNSRNGGQDKRPAGPQPAPRRAARAPTEPVSTEMRRIVHEAAWARMFGSASSTNPFRKGG